MFEDENNAESSTAVQDLPTVEIETLSPAERDAWKKDGSLPQAPKADPPPAAEPASDPAPEKKIAQEPNSKTESRFNELLADRARLREENEGLKKRLEGAPKADPPPEKDRPAEAKSGAPKRPSIEDFRDKSWEEFEAAKEKYLEDLTDWKVEQKILKERETQTAETQKQASQRAWQEFGEKGTEKHGDFVEKVFQNKELPVSELMAEFVLKTADHGIELAYHLGSNPEEATRISALTPVQQIRELTKLDLQFAKSPNGKEPAPKRITSAKAPPSEVGGTATVPEDEALAALAANDTGKYMSIMNARERAKRRG